MANISPSRIQQCLNPTKHFSLWHLATKMLSQLYHNFISFPYFFPSYETCSTHVNPLFHAAIKNLHIKHFDILELLSFIYLTTLGEGITTRAKINSFAKNGNKQIPSLNIHHLMPSLSQLNRSIYPPKQVHSKESLDMQFTNFMLTFLPLKFD